MFRIVLSPIAALHDDEPPTVNGMVLSYRGVDYDFSPLTDGSQVRVEGPFRCYAANESGVVCVVVDYNYNRLTAEDDQPESWDHFTFDVESGSFACPVIRKPVQEPTSNDN